MYGNFVYATDDATTSQTEMKSCVTGVVVRVGKRGCNADSEGTAQ